MKKILILWLLIPIFLNGCSSLNSNFDCPMKPGIRCESLDQVNAQVDRGVLGNDDLKMTSIKTPMYIQSGNSTRVNTYKFANYTAKGEPLRYNETVMRIWVAPYEDTAGNYHKESEIFTVAKPGHWIGSPVKELGSEG